MTDSPQELIRAIEQADSPGRLVASVRALTAARLEVGIPTLIAVLGYNNPGAAVAAVEGLIQLGEIAVQPLLEKLDAYDYGARAYAIRALAGIADPRALDILVEAAVTDFAPSVRRAAAKGLGNLRWNTLNAQQIQSAIARALETLLLISQDQDWAIRYAAVVGLQALSTQLEVRPSIQKRLAEMALDNDPAVRARVQLAHQSLVMSP
ncbi:MULTISPECIES: HEAT repeat domain-containing protein [unclassified Coleofasciculus]|uniref:HEAT repeat domain-containing protein n=1 Tax=Cyanophyceae TaxID=3028117 RepID=UPI0016896AE6|nr:MULTISPECIES: HEAT repeat domain-containing protein [unclassified Coleofasciculus]MBD1888264.1 HEAT repeat domain-containing protein [Coleofasciculus sp. FACHB-SPT9]MBD2541460.1 HEAT repeat domain-containing protein [Coleofasciculus sp. FACHB-SPT36]